MKNIIFLIITIILSSCATIFGGSNQNINVQAVDSKSGNIIENVKCIIIDGEGRSHVMNNNPGIINIGKAFASLNVECKAPNYHQKAISAGNKFNPVSLANIIFWPGFIVDGMTGAINKYPTHFTVMMEKNT